MNVVRLVGGMILVGLVSVPALAQNTVGDLLAGGGKQLTKDEVLAALRGASVSGLTPQGGETVTEWKENGSISGYLTNTTGTRGSLNGTWRVDDGGIVCRDFELRFRETRQIKDCFPVYRMGDQIYFPAAAPADASTGLLKRTIKH
jgi:hypothetical protein